MSLERSCAWCGRLVPTLNRYCAQCGHEAHRPRVLCTCRQCGGPAPPREEIAAWVARRLAR